MVLAILLATGGLSVWQEWRADQAMQRLQQQLAPTARVWRGGILQTLPAEDLVPGDLMDLRAGDLIAADARVLSSQTLLVVESMLTGESMPVEKRARWSANSDPAHSAVWSGTSVRSGTGTARVLNTGPRTRVASAAQPLAQARRPSPFQQGVARFGTLLMRLLLIIVVVALVGHALHGRPALEGLMLAMALAVGLSPELLPVIVSVTLSQGAWRLAHRGILLRRLDAMEDLGSLDVLCVDKTGTLTQGTMRLIRALDAAGRESQDVLRLAACNACLEAGLSNPLDEALVAAAKTKAWFSPDDPLGPLPRKIGEIPYDFERRRLTVLVQHSGHCTRALTKGAVREVLQCCRQRRDEDGALQTLDEDHRQQVLGEVATFGEQGLRVLAVATRLLPPDVSASEASTASVEDSMVFEGLLLFEDPPREDAPTTLRDLAAHGVHIKVITGDNRHVAQAVARSVGLPQTRVITGEDISGLNDDTLWHHAARCTVFAEIAPQHKARLVRALQRHGHVVGFLGDGINDAPALRAADVGLSVQGAADVAHHSADLVLTKPDLEQVSVAVQEGRRSFLNTRQYMAITASANFGNMVSMAAGGWLLPFAPMTAHQILLNNFLSDLPAMTVPQDPMGAPEDRKPQRWDLRDLHRFMWTFGLISTAFDLSTFFLLWQMLATPPTVFQTAWFMISLLTEIVVLLLLRRPRPWWGDRPTKAMAWACGGVLSLGLAAVTWEPLASLLGFAPMGPEVWAVVVVVVGAYALTTEAVKRWRG